jgi:hypothetical protein
MTESWNPHPDPLVEERIRSWVARLERGLPVSRPVMVRLEKDGRYVTASLDCYCKAEAAVRLGLPTIEAYHVDLSHLPRQEAEEKLRQLRDGLDRAHAEGN